MSAAVAVKKDKKLKNLKKIKKILKRCVAVRKDKKQKKKKTPKRCVAVRKDSKQKIKIKNLNGVFFLLLKWTVKKAPKRCSEKGRKEKKNKQKNSN